MEILLILAVSLILFYLAYKYYGLYIEKIFKVKSENITPSQEINDGIDYVPTNKFVVFAHHFASIAGGGPIIGPTIALIFGYIPVWLWILFGTIFIGAVHDYTSLLTSIREKGHSIAEIAEKTLGKSGFLLFITFTVIMLIMLTSVFLNLTTTALSSKYPIEYFGGNSFNIQTVIENGTEYAVIGGIASTSVIFITFFAPILGYLLYKKNIKVLYAIFIAISIAIISVPIGFNFPLHIDSLTWMIVLSIYTIFAAGIPVWLVLQPRDFINSFMLFGGLIVMLAGVIVIGLSGVEISAPQFNVTAGENHLGNIWPILFITVACGAISGFHALVSGGTTAKQISFEKPDAKTVAYGGMILEAVLALLVVLVLSVGISFVQYESLLFPSDPSIKSNPILAFALAMGGVLNIAFGFPVVIGTIFGILMVEGFVVTTLDTAVRLNRYLFDEFWKFIFKKPHRVLQSYFLNALIVVSLMFFFAYTNVFKELWALFGSANQLLSALTLITIAVWLYNKGRKYIFLVLPGIFMTVTAVSALLLSLINKFIPKMDIELIIGDILLILLTIGVIYLSFKKLFKKKIS